MNPEPSSQDEKLNEIGSSVNSSPSDNGGGSTVSSEPSTPDPLPLNGVGEDFLRPIQLDRPDVEQLKRQIFFAVRNYPDQAYQQYESLLGEQMGYYDELATVVYTHHENYRKLYTPQQHLIQEKVRQKEAELTAHLGELSEVKAEREKLEEEVELQKTKLRDALLKIGKAKQSLIMDRIQEAGKELEGHFTNTNQLSDRKQELSQKMYQNRAEVFQKRVNRFERLLETFGGELEAIRAKLPFGEGINASFFQHLLRMGIVLAGAAGWFFATYAVAQHMGNSDFVSLAFAKLIMAGRTLFPDQPFAAMGFNFGIYVLVALLILCIVWLGHVMLKQISPDYKREQNAKKRKTKKKTEEEENSLALELGEGNSIFRTKIESNNLFVFLVQLVPIILIFGVILTAISISVTPDELNDLSISLAGQVVGFSISIGVSGFVLVYLYLVIEPRIIRKNNKGREAKATEQAVVVQDSKSGKKAEESTRGQSSHHTGGIQGKLRHSLSKNWELAVLLGLLVIGLLAMVSGWADNRWVASSVFGVLALFTGFIIAYGVRYQGLVSSFYEIERRHKELSYAIWANDAAQPLPIVSSDFAQFRERMKELNDQFYQLVHNRNEQALAALGYYPVRKKGSFHVSGTNMVSQGTANQNEKPSWARRVLHYFNLEAEPAKPEEKTLWVEEIELPSVYFISEAEKDYFPELATELQYEVSVYIQKARALKSRKGYERRLLNHSTDRCVKLNTEIDKLHERVQELRHKREEHHRVFLKEIENIRKMKGLVRHALADGYDLALTVLEEDKKLEKFRANMNKTLRENGLEGSSSQYPPTQLSAVEESSIAAQNGEGSNEEEQSSEVELDVVENEDLSSDLSPYENGESGDPDEVAFGGPESLSVFPSQPDDVRESEEEQPSSDSEDEPDDTTPNIN